MPEDMSDRMPDRMPEDMSEYMPEDLPHRMPDRMPEDLPDRMPEDMPDRMPENLPDRMPEDMPEHMPEDMPNRMPEDMSDRMPEDLRVTKCVNVMVGITRSKVILSENCGAEGKHIPQKNLGCKSCNFFLHLMFLKVFLIYNVLEEFVETLMLSHLADPISHMTSESIALPLLKNRWRHVHPDSD